jgi:hypothetical protein
LIDLAAKSPVKRNDENVSNNIVSPTNFKEYPNTVRGGLKQSASIPLLKLNKLKPKQ